MTLAGTPEILVSLEGITKAFPGVIANDDVRISGVPASVIAPL